MNSIAPAVNASRSSHAVLHDPEIVRDANAADGQRERGAGGDRERARARIDTLPFTSVLSEGRAGLLEVANVAVSATIGRATRSPVARGVQSPVADCLPFGAPAWLD